MQKTSQSQTDRLFFFDHLRYLMIFFVILIHSAAAYSNILPWWYVRDLEVKSGLFFDVILIVIDVFAMPILFFIAGYFMLSSLQKRGAVLFLKNKFKRLGIPWLLGVTLAGPVFVYIYHISRRDELSVFSYLDYWLMYMKSMGKFYIGFVSSMDTFNHHHFWFISLLLFFFILFTLFFKAIQKWSGKPINYFSHEPSSRKSILFILITVGFLTYVSLCGAHLFIPYGKWFSLTSFLFFQPARLFLYLCYFALGIYAFYKKWFVSGNFPSNLIIAILLAIFFFGGLLVTAKYVSPDTSLRVIIVYDFFYSFFCMSILVVFIAFALRYWNMSSRLNQILSSNSYNVYLIHMSIVVILQLFFMNWLEGFSFVKFTGIFILSAMLSYAISCYAIKPFPCMSVMGLLIIFIFLLIII